MSFNNVKRILSGNFLQSTTLQWATRFTIERRISRQYSSEFARKENIFYACHAEIHAFLLKFKA